jgi:signal transduction histidine kinase
LALPIPQQFSNLHHNNVPITGLSCGKQACILKLISDLEIRTIDRVADQCAIALRQSRLYQLSQAQVQELERLSQVKDDFLSTISHELRSPMATIQMAIQMLEIVLNPMPNVEIASNTADRYLKIFFLQSPVSRASPCRRRTVKSITDHPAL